MTELAPYIVGLPCEHTVCQVAHGMLYDYAHSLCLYGEDPGLTWASEQLSSITESVRRESLVRSSVDCRLQQRVLLAHIEIKIYYANC